ncbi:cyclohexanone 1,2-monooxygenase-like protein [Truncatella angustata]|uniref:Cyclohexanone 1,2-monooxygenase-like protein n=1 Tax=Truncatella angustata TaxID=152316 RepID=A0A9P8UGS0_9PEZI|nr:cyclohexanone 1,2-monooxygenase-like protein [Truncatella angustata]KAH6652042.1 cyclohexanone 1,2-monooxygenase-like protein [Truncatella angustata]
MGSTGTSVDNLSRDGIIELDVVVVGAGFGGCYQLKRFRDEGYKVKLLETALGYGGVWYWNAYPGARVDTTTPLYEFDDPMLWKDWTWKQRFPAHTEIRAYFDYVAERWDLRRDTCFDRFVQSAHWDDDTSEWTIRTREGEIYKARYLSLNTGFAARRYIPDWKGYESFKGVFIHPSYWPHEGLDLKDKKIAVIGTGSTGVQIATELTPNASQLTIFQRSINTCMPMKQINYQNGEQAYPREAYPEVFSGRLKNFPGFDFSFLGRKTFDDDVETRRVTYEMLWSDGSLKFWLATYIDMLFDPDANREAYNFWRDKTRAKINDARIRDILAPIEQPYAFGCKRISLEQGFFEIFNEPHVRLVDINNDPIEEITKNGIKTSEKEHEFDVIICATGYDAVTGGLRQIDIQGSSGETLSDHWKDGAYTYLGMTVSGFPNMFMTYAPQGPTAFCNGPTCAQLQGDWIVNAVGYMRQEGHKKMTAGREAEEEWRETIMKIAYATLLPGAKSWYVNPKALITLTDYLRVVSGGNLKLSLFIPERVMLTSDSPHRYMGDNIPGKPREPLIYLGGVPKYYKALSDVAANNYTGFHFE